MMAIKDSNDAWMLVTQYVQEPGLRRHVRAVAVAMRFYAEKLGYDPDNWYEVGLIHDFDWEIHPNLGEHPIKGSEILREQGWDEETIRIVLSHYTEGTGVPREKPVDFALLACDEITGLIIATALVRPSKNIGDVGLKSVRKKWKDKRFAAGVDRQHVALVTSEFGDTCFEGNLELWEHIGNVLEAMKGAASDLELDGRLAN